VSKIYRALDTILLEVFMTRVAFRTGIKVAQNMEVNASLDKVLLMSRRKAAEQRVVLPDPKYKNVLVAKFINGLMGRGKKSTAEKMFYTSLEIIEGKTKKNGLEVFEKAVENVKPILEVRSRRVGGATYQVPVEVRPNRKQALALRWLIGFAKARPGRTMAEKLADELMAAFNKEGGSIKKREDTHKMAEANRAFAHFRW